MGTAVGWNTGNALGLEGGLCSRDQRGPTWPPASSTGDQLQKQRWARPGGRVGHLFEKGLPAAVGSWSRSVGDILVTGLQVPREPGDKTRLRGGSARTSRFGSGWLAYRGPPGLHTST